MLLGGGLAAHYITYVLVESALLDKLRPKFSSVPIAGQVLRCTHCASFWAGLFVALLLVTPATRWFVFVCAVASIGQLLSVIRWAVDHE